MCTDKALVANRRIFRRKPCVAGRFVNEITILAMPYRCTTIRSRFLQISYTGNGSPGWNTSGSALADHVFGHFRSFAGLFLVAAAGRHLETDDVGELLAEPEVHVRLLDDAPQ